MLPQVREWALEREGLQRLSVPGSTLFTASAFAYNVGVWVVFCLTSQTSACFSMLCIL